MTLPTSGAISLSQIATEFSDSQPNSMSEFYRDGSLVPSFIAVTGSDITAFSGTNAPKFYGGNNTPANNLQVYEGVENTKGAGSITNDLATQRTGLTYTTPYAGTLYVLAVGGGAAGSWWGSGIGYAGSGGGALLVSKTVSASEDYTVVVGGGGAGHGPANGHGQGGSASTVTGPGSFSVTANGGSATSPYSGGSAGTTSISGSSVTTITSSNGTAGGNAASGGSATGGASGISSLTSVTVAAINSGDSEIWAQSTRNSPLNSTTYYWEPGSFNTSTGAWTFSDTLKMGGWGQGGFGQTGDFNGGHGAGGVVIMWMNQKKAVNVDVPTSGSISIGDFYGGEDG